MIRRHLDGLESLRFAAELLPADVRRATGRRDSDRLAQNGHEHGRDVAVETFDERVGLLPEIEDPAAVAVAVRDEQHFGCDLAEPVDHAGGAELGSAARPDRAEARRRQEAHDRRQPVRKHGCDAVAPGDAKSGEPGSGRADPFGQLAVRDLVTGACVVDRDDGRGVRRSA